MIVYSMQPDPDYPGIKYVDWPEHRKVQWLECSPKRVRRKWIPPKCRLHTMENFHDSSCRTKRQSQVLFDRGPSDYLDGIPAFSKRARKALSTRLSKFGEFLPLDVDGDTTEYSFYHCTHLLDVIDLPKSEPVYLSSGELCGLKRLIFDESKMKKAYVFRSASFPNSRTVYVTDEFVKDFPPDLIGFVFHEVWRDSSEVPLPVEKKSGEGGKRGASPKKKQVRTVQSQDRFLTQEDDVIVSVEARDEEDDYRLVESNATFVEKMLGRLIAPEEISADAIRCYCLTEFVFQLDNGGFLQYAFNSELDQLAVTRLTEALERIGAKKTLRAYLGCLAEWEKLGSKEQKAFMQGDYFGNTELRGRFGKVERALTAARDKEDLIDLAASWLKGLSRICYIAENKFGAEVKKRAAKITNPVARRRQRSKNNRWRKR